ncbi:MAG: hypothetical protein MJY99_07045 [Fibrobacter sp.]|nr:hypothetical protein [Fibrobacter sp.]
MNYKVALAAAALLATQSFAIIGIGGHYTPGLGTKMDGMDKPVNITSDGQIKLMHQGFDGVMQGFGFKLWIDLLPIIDIEATLNFHMGSYDAILYVAESKVSLDPNEAAADPTYKEVPLEIELGGTPFGKANPKFVAMNGDLTITYPITSLPIIRPYIGGGLTYYLNSFVLNPEFVTPLVDGAVQEIIGIIAAADPTDPASIQQASDKAKELGDSMQQKIQDQALDEGLKTSIGGHIMAGFRLKLPIIPIAAYANFKYYFGGDYPEEIDPGNMAAEVGVGLAI